LHVNIVIIHAVEIVTNSCHLFRYLLFFGNNGQNVLFEKPYKIYNFIRFSLPF